MPPVQNQGAVGSCTAHAAVAALGHNEIVNKRPYIPQSRLYAYYTARRLEGTVAIDSGATLRDMIRGLAQNGICEETLWPYDTSKVTTAPGLCVRREARKHRIQVYTRLVDVDDMRSCLAAGFPFIFGFTVYEKFESDEVARTGVLNLPGPDERAVGGHAVCAVGYDQDADIFLIRNSWDDDWGQGGYFTMPTAYLANRDLSDDFWTIRL